MGRAWQRPAFLVLGAVFCPEAHLAFDFALLQFCSSRGRSISGQGCPLPKTPIMVVYLLFPVKDGIPRDAVDLTGLGVSNMLSKGLDEMEITAQFSLEVEKIKTQNPNKLKWKNEMCY